MTNDPVYGCPVELSLDLLGGKWKPIILARLKDRPLRYGELRRAVPALSDKVLTQRLRELVEDDLLVAPSGGADMRYRLSERGETLRPVLQSLYDWGLLAARGTGTRFGESRLVPPARDGTADEDARDE